MSASGRSVRGFAAAMVLTGALWLGASGAAAQRPFEPNNSVASATPLGPPGTVSAGIETDNDVDLFEFYVAQPGTQVSFNVTNTSTPPEEGYLGFLQGSLVSAKGGETLVSDVGDTAGLAEGDTGTLAYSFKPGKYYLRLFKDSPEAGVITYDFSFVGRTVDARTMQGLCDGKQRKVTKAEKKLRKAKRKLERAREHGSGRDARKAKKKVGRAKNKVRKDRRNVKRYCVVD